MERGNSKHGPRLDEQMASEDRPNPAQVPGGRMTGGAPPGMTYDEVEARSRFGRFIPMSSLPGDRERLLAGAAELNAPDDVLADLGRLRGGRKYATVNEVWAALGHHNEAHRT